jgi:hypothetical protein
VFFCLLCCCVVILLWRTVAYCSAYLFKALCMNYGNCRGSTCVLILRYMRVVRALGFGFRELAISVYLPVSLLYHFADFSHCLFVERCALCGVRCILFTAVCCASLGLRFGALCMCVLLSTIAVLYVLLPLHCFVRTARCRWCGSTKDLVRCVAHGSHT